MPQAFYSKLMRFSWLMKQVHLPQWIHFYFYLDLIVFIQVFDKGSKSISTQFHVILDLLLELFSVVYNVRKLLLNIAITGISYLWLLRRFCHAWFSNFCAYYSVNFNHLELKRKPLLSQSYHCVTSEGTIFTEQKT